MYASRKSSEIRSRKTKQNQGSMQTGWGIGRIYDGRAAATALNIITELRKENLLLRKPDFSEYHSLTQLLYGFQQEHQIDSRWHRIKSLTSLIEYLEVQGIYAGDKAAGTLIIQDVWDYYPNNPRNFGIKNEFGVGIEHALGRLRVRSQDTSSYFQIITDSNQLADTLSIGYDKRMNKSYVKDEQCGLYLYWNLNCNKPSSLRLQIDLALDWKFYLHSENSDDYSNNQLLPSYSGRRWEDITEYGNYRMLDNSISLKYYFDSRTAGTLLMAALYQARDSKSYTNNIIPESTQPPDTSYSRDSRLLFMIALELTYRLRPETTISGSIDFNKEEYLSPYLEYHEVTEYDRISLGFSINHAIF